MFLYVPFFRTHLPDPPTSPIPFLPRRPPYWGGGHPGAGHREPDHLRCDRAALGRLRLCGQQAWYPGEKNSTGPAGGARYLLPTPGEGKTGFHTAPPLALFLASSTPCPCPCPSRSPGQANRAGLLSPPGKCVWAKFLSWAPCAPSSTPSHFHFIISAGFPVSLARVPRATCCFSFTRAALPRSHLPALAACLSFSHSHPGSRLAHRLTSTPRGRASAPAGPLCPSSFPGAPLAPGTGRGLSFSGAVRVVPSWGAGEGWQRGVLGT